MHSRGINVREVLREGRVVAVLMAIDNGDTFTVVTEVFARGGDGQATVERRPHVFRDADSGLAFLSEALTAFTYLGCEVREQ